MARSLMSERAEVVMSGDPELDALANAGPPDEAFPERIRRLLPPAFLQILNDGRLEITDIVWAPDIVFHSPVLDEPVVGREALLEYVTDIRGAFGGFHVDLEDVVVEDDQAVLRLVHHGVHTGDYFGVPPTGRKVRIPEVMMVRLAPQGPLRVQVVELWLFLNALRLLQQLGLFPEGDPPRPLLKAVIGIQKFARKVRRRSDDA
jgi:predicted ester cyclase